MRIEEEAARRQARIDSGTRSHCRLIVVGLEDLFRGDRDVAARLPLLENGVRDGKTTSLVAARELLSAFHESLTSHGTTFQRFNRRRSGGSVRTGSAATVILLANSIKW